jgi:hypothetical protein
MSPILGARGGLAASAYGFTSTVAAGPSDYQSIATVSGSGVSQIVFSSIPQTYSHLQVRAIERSSRAAGSDYGNIFLNGDTTSANYTNHRLRGDGASVSASAATSDYSYGDYPAASTTTDVFGVFIFDLLDYTSTNKYKTQRVLYGYDANGSGQINFASKLWLSTSAVTSLTFDNRGTNWNANTTFALYGIKG